MRPRTRGSHARFARRRRASRRYPLARRPPTRPSTAPGRPRSTGPSWSGSPTGRSPSCSARVRRAGRPPPATRMPKPPLLLADRVTGIDAEPGVDGHRHASGPRPTSRADAWYLTRRGRMPAGHDDRGRPGRPAAHQLAGRRPAQPGRARLPPARLRADLPRRALPRPGDTLALRDPRRRPRRARATCGCSSSTTTATSAASCGSPCASGQAGFFTDEELAELGGRALGPARRSRTAATPPLDPPARRVRGARASIADAAARLRRGRPVRLLRPGFERDARRTSAPPRIAAGRMLFLDEVTEFDPRGGPWGRGYLRAETPVTPDDWFFAGHFKNDPCMPGTLMFEGCLQAMAFYLAALGYTSTATAGASSPCPTRPYQLRCRGQVTPTSRASSSTRSSSRRSAPGRCPTLYADLLVHRRRAQGVPRAARRPAARARLAARALAAPPQRRCDGGRLARSAAGRPRRRAAVVDGFRFDYASLLACAWGRPSTAFGPMYARLRRHPPRRRACPGPPYHFMTRVTRIDGRDRRACRPARQRRGRVRRARRRLVLRRERRRHDAVRRAAWRPRSSRAAGSRCYVGSALTTRRRTSLFRNLDGTGTLHARDRARHAAPLRTRVTITSDLAVRRA